MIRKAALITFAGLCTLYAAYLVNDFYEHKLGERQAKSFDREPVPVNHAPPVVQLPAPRGDVQVANALVQSHRKDPKKPGLFETREFSELIQRAWVRLPRVSEIRKDKRRDFHFAPPELLEIAQELSVISESMERDSRLIASGRSFLMRCALENGVMSAVRAVCLRDLKHWSANALLDMSVFPQDIKNIVRSLPATPP